MSTRTHTHACTTCGQSFACAGEWMPNADCPPYCTHYHEQFQDECADCATAQKCDWCGLLGSEKSPLVQDTAHLEHGDEDWCHDDCWDAQNERAAARLAEAYDGGSGAGLAEAQAAARRLK